MRKTSIIAAIFLVSAACGKGSSSGPVDKGEGPDKGGAPPKTESISLQGAGATFPYPLYSKWMSEYEKVAPTVKIDYQSIGSGGGIAQITKRTVDFGATDAPMNEEELGKAPGIVHIPTTLGAVVLAYNVPGVDNLKLSPDLVAEIFLGTITAWNDPKIAALNPDAKLPDTQVTVAYRSEGSGTTAVFTGYLATVSPAWKEKVGQGKSVKFPVGLGAKGNEGVAGQIKTSPGTIGYIELAYAMQTGQPAAQLQNKAGNFITATPDSVTAAAASVQMPDGLNVSIVDAPGADAYPIAAYTYILVYEDAADTAKGKALAQFLWWAIHDGQKLTTPLHYAPLPADVVGKVESRLKTLRSGGQTLLAG